MKRAGARRRVSKRLFNFVRWLTRCLSVLIVLAICAFVFLRLYGVPKPILRIIVKKVNDAGVPIDVEHVRLTLRGWRAANVSYYSSHPDDLEPIMVIDEVLLARRGEAAGDSGEGRVFNIEAVGVAINPSVEWGVEIPEGDAARRVDHARLSLVVDPTEVQILRGELSWLGVDFRVDGRIDISSINLEEKSEARDRSLGPKWMTAEQFRVWQNRLKSILLKGASTVNVEFFLDLEAIERSRARLDLEASDVAFRNVEFSAFRGGLRYEDSAVWLDRVELRKEDDSILLSGEYDIASNTLKGSLRNAITSNELLLIAPQPVLDVLVKAELRISELPRFRLEFGPAEPLDLLNALSGSFSIRDIAYRGLEIESLKGDLSRSGNRLDLKNLKGVARGQEHRAAEVGTCLRGGAATGEVYWDTKARSLGIKASGKMDPNLLLRPLDLVSAATNAIDRFKFQGEPPEIDVELGACYTNWPDFFLRIHAMAEEVRVHEAELSSINVSAFYQRLKLELDPIMAMKDGDFLKGSVAILFAERAATFDVFGSMPPAVIEDGAYPGFNLFGEKIKVAGKTRIAARGKLEWETMRATDFTAEVEAESLEIPIAKMAGFTAVVTGSGPLLEVRDAKFGIYGGDGEAEFSISLDPTTNSLPYEMDIHIAAVEFQECLKYFRETVHDRVSGKLTARVQFAADMSRDFFETANGTGTLSVVQGQLADLPFFSGFSQLMRHVIPGFNVFTITKLESDYAFDDGVVSSKNVYFEGDVISAKARGSYSKKRGFDARVQAQILRDNRIARVFRAITDPIFKLFEMRLTGSLDDPKWRLDNFTPNSVISGAAD